MAIISIAVIKRILVKLKISQIIFAQFVTLILIILLTPTDNTAQIRIDHNPLGYENLYDEREIDVFGSQCERIPHDPVEGDQTTINFKSSPISVKQNCEIEIWKNGKSLDPVKAEFDYNKAGESYWSANVGAFKKGEKVDYRIRGVFDEVEQRSEVFSFCCLGWDNLTYVTGVSLMKDVIQVKTASTDQIINPLLEFMLVDNNILKISFYADAELNTDDVHSTNYNVEKKPDFLIAENDNMSLKIKYQPFSYEITNKFNNEVVRGYHGEKSASIFLLNDGNKRIYKIKEELYSDQKEKLFGFGERYNSLNQRGNIIDNYMVNIWKNQKTKSYIPVPFFFTNRNYGIFLNTTYYVKYDLDTVKINKISYEANYGRSDKGSFEYYYIIGNNPRNLIQSFAELTGKPAPIPVWSLGSWISANEWDKQSEIEAQLDSLDKYNIPNTVVVIEAWSDEETFYIFNDALYENKNGGEVFSLNDFKFSGRWPNPAGMTNTIHNKDMKLVLWNIPILKSSNVENEQREVDELYAIKKGYVVKNPDGSPYRMPPSWFGNSLNPDFTNPEAVKWWQNKRRYLIEELGIDAFKCDGGEFIWGRDLQFYNGKTGEELRNKYSNLYIKAYNDFVKTFKEDAITFHRSGTFGIQAYPIAWNGDQNSSFAEFKSAIRSILNLSMSGISFVAYDIAGYYNHSLTPELYKRSVAQATFSPIMQFHSAYGGDPEPSMERSPWNLSKLFNDPSLITVYKKYANTRYNIIPYLYTETLFTSETGIPLMRPLFLDYPEVFTENEDNLDYMLGRNFLIHPITDSNVISFDMKLPTGNWYVFWDLKKYTGNKNYSLKAPVDYIPVFVKEGSIIPLNLNSEYKLSGEISNSLNTYSYLTFIVLPGDSISYEFKNYTINRTEYIISNRENNKLTISTSKLDGRISFIVAGKYSKILSESNVKIKSVSTFDEFRFAENSYWRDDDRDLLYFTFTSTNEKNTIILR